MSLKLGYEGFNYVDFYNGEYGDVDSLPSVAATGANSVALTPDFGIDVAQSTVYAGGATTDTVGDLGTAIGDATESGMTSFVRPLIDYLYNQVSANGPVISTPGGLQQIGPPGSYYVPPGEFNSANLPTTSEPDAKGGTIPATQNGTVSGTADTTSARSFLNPADINVATFFGSPTTPGSYDYMIVNEAKAAAAAGATLFSVGTELDALADNSNYTVYWDNLIADVRAAAPSLKLTYSSTWTTAGLVTFWNKLDYVGIDGYMPLSNVVPDQQNNNPSLASLTAGYTTPNSQVQIAYSNETVGAALAAEIPGAPAGGWSVIDAFDKLAEQSKSGQFIFTELGFPNDTSAATDPTGGSTNQGAQTDPTYADPSLQAELYQAFFNAWGGAQQTAEANGGTVDGIPFALDGVYFYDWTPDESDDGFSVTANAAAEQVIQQGFATPATTNPVVVMSETGTASVTGSEGTPTLARGTAGTSGTGALAGDSDSNGAALSITAVQGGTVGKSFNTQYGSLTLNSDGSYLYSANAGALAAVTATGSPALDTVTFTVSDANGATHTSTLTFSDYRNPIAVAETGTTSAGRTATGTAGTSGTGATAGDSDLDGASLSASILNNVGVPENGAIAGNYGTLTLNSNGSYSYVADSASALSSAFAADDGAPLTDSFNLFVAGPYTTFATTTLTFTIDEASSQTPTKGDFTGAGKSDVLFHDSASGDTGYWITNSNGQVTGFNDFGDGNTAYQIVGVGDFDTTGHTEILFHDSANGDTGYWTTDGNGHITGFNDFGNANTAYQVAGVGDFDGGNYDQVLFHNPTTGDTGYWTSNGSGQLTGFHDLGDGSAAYQIVGIGDFDNSGPDEILFHDPTTGDTGYWTTNANGQVTGFHDLADASTAYQIVGIGDFDNSGHDEILFHDPTTGDTGYWITNSGGQVTGFHDFGNGSTAYQVAAVGDFDGSGHDEVLFHNPTTGDTGYWTTNSGGQVMGFHDLANGSTAYSIVPL